MRNDSFYMMYPPVEPVREEKYRFTISVEPGYSLLELVEKIPEKHRATAMLDCDGYGDPGDYILVVWYDEEPDEIFETRVKWYEKQKRQYEDWKKKNKKKIEQHEKKKLKDETTKLIHAKKHVETAIETNKKKLLELEKKLKGLSK